MNNNIPGSRYQPIFALSRGDTPESVHFGAVAVVNVYGQLVAHYGDPAVVTYLRSTAKPFQVIPFLEQGGQSYYNLTSREIALMCASHSGTDAHVSVAKSIQAKAGFSENDLLCGVHKPMDVETAEALRERMELPTPNRHNCSGKHSGMVAFARMAMAQDRITDNQLYIDPQHPIQKEILRTFAEICNVEETQIALGTDGCSAPNFAVAIWNTAWGYARLCDPETGNILPPERVSACHQVTNAMTSFPEMVAGPGRFDTRLMDTTIQKIVSKGGAEGYQGIGIMPGALAPDSPALGIALKIADGDSRGTVRSAVALEVLRQLGALSPKELEALADIGPTFQIYNWRQIQVGKGYPLFTLSYAN